MCGIFGIFNYLDSKIDKSFLSQTNFYLDKRGPDYNEKKYITSNRNSVMGHYRLSIIDLSPKSNQPFYSSKYGLTIVYNGEIFNYIELRDELKELGYEFTTTSDTEVLLYCWHKWGHECLSKLNGMFAFCIHDSKSNLYFMVRDRYGIKPLYYASKNSSTYFSSSIGHLYSSIETDIDISMFNGINNRIYDYSDTKTIYKDILPVKPGEVIRINGQNGFKKTSFLWYDINQVEKDTLQIEDEAAIDEFRDLFKSAVHLRLRSDVPVANLLSGGIDSSLIAYLAGQKVKNFVFGTPHDTGSEGPVAREFAKKNNLQCEFVNFSQNEEDILRIFEKTLSDQEAPIGSLSPVAQNLLYEKINDSGYKVALGGQGGDEVFCGYRKYLLMSMRQPGNCRSLVSNTVGFILTAFQELKQFSIYYSAIKRTYGKTSSFVNYQNCKKPIPFENQIDDITTYSLPMLLRYEDRNSMGNSVESRLPFLDHRVVEYGLRLKLSSKVHFGYGKYFLRKSFTKELGDSLCFNRSKRGFDISNKFLTKGLSYHIYDKIYKHSQSFEDMGLSIHAIQPKLFRKKLKDPNYLNQVLGCYWLSRHF
jgi:asparagine synthase (glutamine-hydrolysing)